MESICANVAAVFHFWRWILCVLSSWPLFKFLPLHPRLKLSWVSDALPCRIYQHISVSPTDDFPVHLFTKGMQRFFLLYLCFLCMAPECWYFLVSGYLDPSNYMYNVYCIYLPYMSAWQWGHLAVSLSFVCYFHGQHGTARPSCYLYTSCSVL